MPNKATWMRAVGLVFALAVALTFLLEPVNLPLGQHGPDGRSYLSQLYSLLFEQDMLLFHAKALVGQQPIVTSTGYALELRNIGTALCFLPFYALGHLICRLSGATCGVADLPVGACLSLGNWVFGLLALVVILRLVEPFAPRRWAAVAVAAVALGSPFLYYWTRFFNPHVPALLLVALLALIWQRTQSGRRWHHWLLMGVLGGLATTVASYNLVFLLLPAFDLLQSLPRRRVAAVGDGLVLAAGALAGLAPQLVTWQLMFGSFLRTPYSRQLLWLEPGLPQILLSSYHGLYFYAPVLAIATLGFVPLFRQDRALALKALLVFVAHAYVSSCNIAWWAGASFGARYLLTSLPLLALPLAALLANIRWRGLACVALVACLAWSYGLLLADYARLIDPGQYIPPRWQLDVQAEVLRRFPELVQQHLLTPRFEAAPLVAVPAALLLGGLVVAVWNARRADSRWLAVVAVAVPLAVAAGLLLSDGSSQREIARLEAEGQLAGYLRADFDVYDLSENYWQRGAYRFVRGATDGARADWDTAHRLLPERDWVRFHRAGREHVPHPLAWQVDDHLTLVGWESETGTVTLYWLAGDVVLEPSYRVELRWVDAAGQEVAAHVSAEPDPWRALAGDVVRMRYRAPGRAEDQQRTLAIVVHTADAGQVIGSLEVPFD
jgi:hypothetical protein